VLNKITLNLPVERGNEKKKEKYFPKDKVDRTRDAHSPISNAGFKRGFR
jgi:hypothetical protein